jgi:hypothetical protein
MRLNKSKALNETGMGARRERWEQLWRDVRGRVKLGKAYDGLPTHLERLE